MNLSDLFYRRLPASKPVRSDMVASPQRETIVNDIIRWFYAYRDFNGPSVRPSVDFDVSSNGRYITITVNEWFAIKRRDRQAVRDEVARILADDYPGLETPGDVRIIIACAKQQT